MEEESKEKVEEVRVEEEFGEKDPRAIYRILLVVAIILILLGSYLIGKEILEVKNACESLDGIHSLKIYPPRHLCNNQNFSKYSIGGWDFESNRDFG